MIDSSTTLLKLISSLLLEYDRLSLGEIASESQFCNDWDQQIGRFSRQERCFLWQYYKIDNLFIYLRYTI